MNLSAFIGNQDAKSALSDARSAGRFPHAIVIQGEHGTGKRTFARLISNALVCRDKENAPCMVCPSCVRAQAGSHPDIRAFEGSGATRSLSVDNAKEIISDSYRMPEEADVSIYLIFIENKISEATQNKLLKLIEEPPKNTIFIITCSSAEILLPTIRSRVQVYTLHAPAEEEAAAYVSEKLAISLEEARERAKICGGNIGRMFDESDDTEAKQSLEAAIKIAQLINGSNKHEMLKVTAPMIKDRKLFAETLERLELILRDALVLRNGGEKMISSSPETAEKLSRLTLKRLMKLMEIPREYKVKLERNANMTLLVTAFCADLC